MTAPALTRSEVDVVWEPFEGFQRRAMACNTDEMLLGGAKGCGKGDVLTVQHLRYADRPEYPGLFLREEYTELVRQIDRAHQIYGKLSIDRRPVWNGEKQRFTWPSKAFVQYGHCATVEDVKKYQGGNWGRISFDELGNVMDADRIATQLIAELRWPDPLVRRQFAASANPGFPGHAAMKRRYVTPCGKDGKKIVFVPLKLPDGRVVQWSKAFIPGRVTDNPVYANDATYMAQLMLLPERMRKCLLEGDWDASSGTAFEEIDPAAHLVPYFECPAHWPYISAYDHGYDHWAVFMWGRVSDDGRIYICDTIRRRLLRDWDLAATLNTIVPKQALKNVQAGHDCWAKNRAKDPKATSTRDFFAQCGIQLVQATLDRVHGYANALRYLAWRETDFLPVRQPMLVWMNNPANRWMVEEHLPSMVCDPDDPRDVLKNDADSETGVGGDDGYDCLRNLVNSKPLKALSGAHLLKKGAFHPDVLREEQNRLMSPDTSPRRGGKLRGFFRAG